MKVRYIAALCAAVLVSCFGAHAEAARWDIENNYDVKWDFEQGFVNTNNMADTTNSHVWVKKGTNSSPLQFGYTNDVVTNSSAMQIFPHNGNGWRSFAEYQVTPGTKQFVFKADVSYVFPSDRGTNAGMKWRYDPTNTNEGPAPAPPYPAYSLEGSLQGTTGSGMNYYEETAGVGQTFGNAAWVGGSASNLMGLSGQNSFVTNQSFQVEWNVNNSGLLEIYYKSNRQTPAGNLYQNQVWNNATVNRGNGDWVLVFTRNIPAAQLALGITELALGGSMVNGQTQETWDNIYFKAVPEPSTVVLCGLAVPAIGALVLRRRKAK